MDELAQKVLENAARRGRARWSKYSDSSYTRTKFPAAIPEARPEYTLPWNDMHAPLKLFLCDSVKKMLGRL